MEQLAQQIEDICSKAIKFGSEMFQNTNTLKDIFDYPILIIVTISAIAVPCIKKLFR